MPQEVNWSGVLTDQIYGRVHRDGQTLPAFAFQLAGQDTVDMLLAMIALRKASVAKDYISAERREGEHTIVRRISH